MNTVKFTVDQPCTASWEAMNPTISGIPLPWYKRAIVAIAALLGTQFSLAQSTLSSERHAKSEVGESEITLLITNENEENVIGANVLWGTTGRSTDVDGRVAIPKEVLQSEEKITISYIGYEDMKERPWLWA